MNWMWDWSDTVDICQKTFSTMLELMEEYPNFCFSQSQAKEYEILEKYNPQILEKIKKGQDRVDGRSLPTLEWKQIKI